MWYWKYESYSILILEMSRIIAAVGVKAIKNKRLIPSRAAIVLVKNWFQTHLSRVLIFEVTSESHCFICFQTKSAVNQIKKLLDGKPEFVSCCLISFCSFFIYVLTEFSFSIDRVESRGQTAWLQRFELYAGLCQGKRKIGWRSCTRWWISFIYFWFWKKYIYTLRTIAWS